jgi:molybdenum cofactor cytidylyltransferase
MNAPENLQRSLSAVVLAAGAGRRFGGGKLVAAFAGRPLIAGALGAALAAPAAEVIVAVPSLADPVAEAVRAFNHDPRLKLVPVLDRDEGLAASLRAAVRVLDPKSAGMFVFLGDMPRLPHGIAADLAEALNDGALAAQPFFEGCPGHPTLMARALYPQLLALAGDQGARSVLAGLGERLIRLPVEDDGVVFDVDTPEQLKGG